MSGFLAGAWNDTSGFVMLNEVKHPWVDSFARTGKVNPCEIGSIRPVRIPFAWIPRFRSE